jgi:hypothetical protein
LLLDGVVTRSDCGRGGSRCTYRCRVIRVTVRWFVQSISLDLGLTQGLLGLRGPEGWGDRDQPCGPEGRGVISERGESIP